MSEKDIDRGTMRRGPISEIERERWHRESGGQSLSSVLDSVSSSEGMSDALRATWNISRAWFSVNGDYERTHTVGTFVDDRRAGTDPVLVVYVDSKAAEVDLMARREIYPARLASCGMRFSEVRFRLSKQRYLDRRAQVPSHRATPADVTPAPLPALTEEEDARVDEFCSKLPASLRESVSRAMRVSYQVQKREHS